MSSAAQKDLRRKLREQGVEFTDEDQVYLREDTEIGRGTVVEPFVVFGPGVKIGSGCVIKAFSHLEETEIGDKCIIGPFARVRGGSRIEAGVGIGNFVEVARSQIGKGTTAWHLSFIGDCAAGENVEIGGGVITCNFDGVQKNKTRLENGSFIGSNVTLVAPVTIGANALAGAGSVIDADAAADELVLGRAELKHKSGGAARYRQKKRQAVNNN